MNAPLDLLRDSFAGRSLIEASAGTDCFADKGVMYAEVIKGGKAWHLFATHTASFDTDEARKLRQIQFGQIRTLAASLKIPASDTESKSPTHSSGTTPSMEAWRMPESAAMMRLPAIWASRRGVRTRSPPSSRVNRVMAALTTACTGEFRAGLRRGRHGPILRQL